MVNDYYIEQIATAIGGGGVDQLRVLEDDYQTVRVHGVPDLAWNRDGAVEAALCVAGLGEPGERPGVRTGSLPDEAAGRVVVGLLTPMPDFAAEHPAVARTGGANRSAAELARLRRLDDLAGGRDWRAAARCRARLLAGSLGRPGSLKGSDPAALGAFAQMAQFVGWCEYEAGLDQMAWQWWIAALRAAHAAGDALVVGHVAATMALWMLQDGQPQQAILLCSLVQKGLDRVAEVSALGRVKALLLIRQALATASLPAASVVQCTTLMEQGRTLLAGVDKATGEADWTYYIDGSLFDLYDGMAALQLGEHEAAASLLEKALAETPAEMVRNRAVGLAWLALARLAEGRPQVKPALEAATAAAMLAETQVGSRQLLAALRRVHLALDPQKDPAVRDYCARFAQFRSPVLVPLPIS